jgi:regulator of cell morphogenesis and NO signaling
MPDTNETLGEIAASGPEARSVLLRYRLDFCCRGGRTLSEACAHDGISADEVVNALSAAATRSSTREDWVSAPLPVVVDHILNHYHAPLPAHLDAVVAAAEKVERVHGAKDACPRGLAEHLRFIRDDLMSHMAKEEHVLFPAIKAGRAGAMLGGPVHVMMEEHLEHGQNLAKMRALAHDLVPPADACATWRTLYEELGRLEAELMAHIHLENHVVFPRAVGVGSPQG